MIKDRSMPRLTIASGSALLEVVITIFILAIGLLGIAGMQSRIHVMEYESFQRAQAIVIMNDLVDRISNNRAEAEIDLYVSKAVDWLVPGNIANDCAAQATLAERDLCEVGNVLKGAANKTSEAATTGNGTMDQGRICVSRFVETNNKTFDRCQVGVQVHVAWRGKGPTVVPVSNCGQVSGDPTDNFRRVISTRIGTGDVAGGTVVGGVTC